MPDPPTILIASSYSNPGGLLGRSGSDPMIAVAAIPSWGPA